MRAVRSQDAVTTFPFWWPKDTDKTGPSCFKVTVLPVARFRIRTVLSCDANAMSFPSGLNAPELTGWLPGAELGRVTRRWDQGHKAVAGGCEDTAAGGIEDCGKYFSTKG